MLNPLMASCTVAVLGDSLSTGVGVNANDAWPTIIKKKGFIVKSLSGAGNTSHDARIIWDQADKGSDILIVAIGANDALRGMPATELEKNLNTILTQYKSGKGKEKNVLLVVPELPDNYPEKFKLSYDHIYTKIAKEYEAKVISMRYRDAVVQDLLTDDMLHPNEKGHAFIAKNINDWLKNHPICKKDT